MKTHTNISKWTCVLIFFCISIVLHGQILDLKEIPTVGKKIYPLKGKSVYYVDINSVIDIQINKEMLKEKINKNITTGNIRVDSLLTALKNLKSFSDTLLVKSTTFNNSLRAYNRTGSVTDLEMLEQSLNSLAKAEDDFLKAYTYKNPWLYKKANAMFDDYKSIAEIFEDQVKEMQNFLNQQLNQAINSEGVFVQVGAWIITKSGANSIHLDGFDEYPMGKYYEWKTVNLQLDETQIKELESMHNMLSDNAKSYDEIFNEIGAGYREMLLGVIGPVNDSIIKIFNTVNYLIEKSSNTQKDLKEQLTKIESSVKDYKMFVKEWIESYKNGNIIETDKFQLLMRFYKDQQKLISQTSAQFDKIKESVIKVQFILKNASANLKDSVNKLVLQVSSLPQTIETKFSVVLSGLNTMVNGAKFNSDLLTFGDKVKKLAIDVVPSSTSFSLKFTGKRDPGDQVILKVGAGTPSLTKAKDLEVIYLNLLAAEPHINMAVAYDFAWPVTRIGEAPPNGPSYSTLYKFRSRKPIYRNVIDVGLGLNFAVFDFNKDDIPEISTGLCLSVLRDYLQAGWGFNFNANLGYYFVGIRIPVSINNIYFNGSTKDQNN
ncbi:MAG: hypothetical protein M0Q38_02725 [Bacteroidales bacterium]|jgi:hypothetical protein|nr:hypothetical protein [Bacteroidales bacterium]